MSTPNNPLAFEEPAVVTATIDAIMKGEFEGYLVSNNSRYASFKRPPVVFRRTLSDGTAVNRRSHPHLAIAEREWIDGQGHIGTVGLTREILQDLFAKGLVIEHGPGQTKKDAYHQQQAAERSKKFNEENAHLSDLKTKIVAGMDPALAPMAKALFDLAAFRNVNLDEATVRYIGQTSADSLKDMFDTIISNPYMTELKVTSAMPSPKPEPQAAITH